MRAVVLMEVLRMTVRKMLDAERMVDLGKLCCDAHELVDKLYDAKAKEILVGKED